MIASSVLKRKSKRMCLVFLKTSGVSFNTVMLKEKRRGVCRRQTLAKPKQASSDCSDTEGTASPTGWSRTHFPHRSVSGILGLEPGCVLCFCLWDDCQTDGRQAHCFFPWTLSIAGKSITHSIFQLPLNDAPFVVFVSNFYFQLLFVPLLVWHRFRFNIFRACIFSLETLRGISCGATKHLRPFFSLRQLSWAVRESRGWNLSGDRQKLPGTAFGLTLSKKASFWLQKWRFFGHTKWNV